ncbi:MAG TPA: SDR family NAD(P)-dependent oxidoreductase [Mycobacteriales bacterium]|jgi:NAD(P)-dependent dehydrogenase (short-subunit alcohol dehydrogenase family)|nr:SDR family NAD(P)-dependent oxidoreductase [Mycobacteriales bacterium]
MQPRGHEGPVALVTGGGNGIGKAIAIRLAEERDARVVIADIDSEAGEAVARQVGGLFVPCDVSSYAANQAAVDAALSHHGRLDIAALNAGVAPDFDLGEDYDPARFRQLVGINLIGVGDGAHLAYMAMRECGGGDIIATSSIAGMLPVPLEPLYASTKHGVVGLVRGQGPAWDDVRLNAICPGFADTKIIDRSRGMLERAGIQVMDPNEVAEAFATILAGGGTGQCFTVLPGQPVRPFEFAEMPGLAEASYPDPVSVRRTSRRAPGGAPHGQIGPAGAPRTSNGPGARRR